MAVSPDLTETLTKHTQDPRSMESYVQYMHSTKENETKRNETGKKTRPHARNVTRPAERQSRASDAWLHQK
jgi:hypothetical protein